MLRRLFLADLGRATVAMTVLGATVSACNTVSGGAPGSTRGTVDYRRVNLGFVSAYVLVRDGQATVVDTGVVGSAPAIGETLSAAGAGWDAVAHVVLTHRHPDHVGSLGDVLGLATDAAAYAGEADLGAISSPRPLTAVHDGDEVFGLRIIATPGHTAGHISVLDQVTGVLVAGDALTGTGDGGVGGPSPRFTDDMATAHESVRTLATWEFNTAFFGHGEPVDSDASARVAELAAAL